MPDAVDVSVTDETLTVKLRDGRTLSVPPEARSEHRRVTNQLVLLYASCSERFRFGQPGVEFPSGTYPPPIIQAAA